MTNPSFFFRRKYTTYSSTKLENQFSSSSGSSSPVSPDLSEKVSRHLLLLLLLLLFFFLQRCVKVKSGWWELDKFSSELDWSLGIELFLVFLLEFLCVLCEDLYTWSFESSGGYVFFLPLLWSFALSIMKTYNSVPCRSEAFVFYLLVVVVTVT